MGKSISCYRVTGKDETRIWQLGNCQKPLLGYLSLHRWEWETSYRVGEEVELRVEIIPPINLTLKASREKSR